MIMATLRLIHKRTTENRRDRNGPKRTRTKNQKEPKRTQKSQKRNQKERKEPKRARKGTKKNGKSPKRTKGTQKPEKNQKIKKGDVPENLYFKGFLENALCNAKMPFGKMGTTAHKNGYQNAPQILTK